jgi:hypothetical protein
MQFTSALALEKKIESPGVTLDESIYKEKPVQIEIY